jgi:signal peptidase I
VSEDEVGASATSPADGRPSTRPVEWERAAAAATGRFSKEHAVNSDLPEPSPEPAAEQEPAPKKRSGWLAELRGLLWILVAIFAFQSGVAKAFYISSESMMPGLVKGDHVIVTKYPYGWSWVSPALHLLPPFSGRLLGHLPERGDVVILTPPGRSEDLIKRVIGLPGDTVEMIGGALYLNGTAVRREPRGEAMIPVDANISCPDQLGRFRRTGADGRLYCRLPIVRETLPGGRSYDTIDLGPSAADDYGPVTIPPGHVFLMGDNRDNSADSRFPLDQLGLGGPVPWENIAGRAEFITYSDDGTSRWLNPVSWVTALRGGRAGTSLHPRRSGGAKAGDGASPR